MDTDTIRFENIEVRRPYIEAFLQSNGVQSLAEAKAIVDEAHLPIFNLIHNTQRICFDDACWAYTVGAAAAVRRKGAKASDIANTLGEGLQSFCIPSSVAEQRQVGLGHGRLAAMILSDDVRCFAFLAGHESFAAAEGAIRIVRSANRVRNVPIRIILNGLGKDAAEIISRINGFTYVKNNV